MSSPAPQTPPYAVPDPVRPAGPGRGIAALVLAILTVGVALLGALPGDQYVKTILMLILLLPTFVLLVLAIVFGVLAIRSGHRTGRLLGIIAMAILAAFVLVMIVSTVGAMFLLANQTY